MVQEFEPYSAILHRPFMYQMASSRSVHTLLRGMRGGALSYGVSGRCSQYQALVRQLDAMFADQDKVDNGEWGMAMLGRFSSDEASLRACCERVIAFVDGNDFAQEFAPAFEIASWEGIRDWQTFLAWLEKDPGYWGVHDAKDLFAFILGFMAGMPIGTSEDTGLAEALGFRLIGHFHARMTEGRPDLGSTTVEGIVESAYGSRPEGLRLVLDWLGGAEPVAPPPFRRKRLPAAGGDGLGCLGLFFTHVRQHSMPHLLVTAVDLERFLYGCEWGLRMHAPDAVVRSGEVLGFLAGFRAVMEARLGLAAGGCWGRAIVGRSVSRWASLEEAWGALAVELGSATAEALDVRSVADGLAGQEWDGFAGFWRVFREDPAAFQVHCLHDLEVVLEGFNLAAGFFCGHAFRKERIKVSLNPGSAFYKRYFRRYRDSWPVPVSVFASAFEGASAWRLGQAMRAVDGHLAGAKRIERF